MKSRIITAKLCSTQFWKAGFWSHLLSRPSSAKRILERREIQTSSSFVKIWLICLMESTFSQKPFCPFVSFKCLGIPFVEPHFTNLNSLPQCLHLAFSFSLSRKSLYYNLYYLKSISYSFGIYMACFFYLEPIGVCFGFVELECGQLVYDMYKGFLLVNSVIREIWLKIIR